MENVTMTETEIRNRVIEIARKNGVNDTSVVVAALKAATGFSKAKDAHAEHGDMMFDLLEVYMTSMTPEQKQPPQQTALVPQRQALALTGDPTWDAMRQQAEIVFNSGLLPKTIKNVESVITIALMGKALDLPLIVAINNIDVIQGKPTIKPQLMLALIKRSGQLEDMEIVDNGTACAVTMKRRGQTPHTEVFSMDDAMRMQSTEWDGNNKKSISLAEKHQWKTMPAVMRKWRAVSACARVVFPDIILGFYMPEEIDNDVVVEAE